MFAKLLELLDYAKSFLWPEKTTNYALFGFIIGTSSICLAYYFSMHYQRKQRIATSYSLSNNYQLLPLVSKIPVSRNAFIFRFQLGSPTAIMDLPIGSHVLLKNEHGISRPYTPITNDINPDHRGFMDLLIKVYDNGEMTQYLHKHLQCGSGQNCKIMVRKFNGKLHYSKEGKFTIKKSVLQNISHCGMICGGTGITPMLQIIRYIDEQQHEIYVNLLFANSTLDDILMKEEIVRICNNNKYINVHFTVSRMNEESVEAQVGIGRVNRSMIEKYIFGPSESTLMLICGPKTFTQVVKEYLSEIGHSQNMIYKF